VALVWQNQRIEHIRQTFTCQLAIFVLLTNSCIVNSQTFHLHQLVQQAGSPNLSQAKLSSFTVRALFVYGQYYSELFCTCLVVEAPLLVVVW